MQMISAIQHQFKWVLCGLLVLLVMADFAHAQNSLGIGRPEQIIKPEGPFAGILFWIQQQQQQFYQLMTGALKEIRAGSGWSGILLLSSLSFAYGVLHAAGPGHGKAVISSYMLANEVVLKRGIALSFLSSFLQAMVAIIAIGLLIFVLRGFGFKQAEFSRYLEIVSYAGVMLLGLWLLAKKLLPLFKGFVAMPRSSHALVHHHAADNVGEHNHNHNHKTHHHNHEHSADVCGECGHSHAPMPEFLAGNADGEFGAREAFSAVMAVGLRPCTGAMIVLTFSFLNGLYFAGIVSTLAMAVGTGITVSFFAAIAVGAKGLALKFTKAEQTSQRARLIIEICGAVFIFLIGATLLAASLA